MEIYENGEKKRKSVILFFTQLHLVSKKMRVSKIANLVNAPVIHDQHIVVRLFQILTAAHRAQTESLCTKSLLRACFPPSCPQTPQWLFASSELVCLPAAHRALCPSMVYIKTVKNGNRYFFHSAAPRLKKMRFSKIANFINAPAIHNQNSVR